MEIEIREATPVDTAVVVRLITELASSISEKSSITEEYVKKYLTSPSSKVLLAEIQGRTVGLLSYSVRPDLYHASNTALIEELVVLEEFRSRGVGSALMSELFSRLSACGCAEVSLSVLKDNLKAIRFYQSQGMTDEALYLEKHFDSVNPKGLHHRRYKIWNRS
jgi:ribosomal protein S18 acetylase RimI-like enzyme